MQELRPDLDQHAGLQPVYHIYGSPAKALPGSAYAGKLQIRGGIGNSRIIEAIGAEDLPAGSSVYVDNATQEVVIAWPAYSIDATALVQPGFEDGGLTGWTVLRKGQVANKVGIASNDTGRPRSGSRSALWRGNKGNGHAGGVEALWINTARAPAYPGRVINASAWIALDDTVSSANRGRLMLVFFDDAGNIIGDPLGQAQGTYPYKGDLIRGNDSNYRLSRLRAVSPPGAQTVAVAVWTTANDSNNSGVRFDDVMWDAPSIVGINVEAEFPLTIRVRDDTGRTAAWVGVVRAQNFTNMAWVGSSFATFGSGNGYVGAVMDGKSDIFLPGAYSTSTGYLIRNAGTSERTSESVTLPFNTGVSYKDTISNRVFLVEAVSGGRLALYDPYTQESTILGSFSGMSSNLGQGTFSLGDVDDDGNFFLVDRYSSGYMFFYRRAAGVTGRVSYPGRGYRGVVTYGGGNYLVVTADNPGNVGGTLFYALVPKSDVAAGTPSISWSTQLIGGAIQNGSTAVAWVPWLQKFLLVLGTSSSGLSHVRMLDPTTMTLEVLPSISSSFAVPSPGRLWIDERYEIIGYVSEDDASGRWFFTSDNGNSWYTGQGASNNTYDGNSRVCVVNEGIIHFSGNPVVLRRGVYT